MVTTVVSAVLNGIRARKVLVELNISRGFPCLNYVGLASVGIKESKERVRAALENSDYDFPHKRVTVNFLPAAFKKEGSHLDLAIALAMIEGIDEYEEEEDLDKTNQEIELNYGKYLGEDGEIFKITDKEILEDIEISKDKKSSSKCNDFAVFGELSLNGDVVEIQAIVPLLLEMKEQGFTEIIIPYKNLEQAKILKDINVYPVKSLKEAVEVYLKKQITNKVSCIGSFEIESSYPYDMKDVQGQYQAKRAVEISAAGMHNILLCGSPGSGKSMLSKRLISILPDLTYDEIIELSKIYSISNHSDRIDIIKNRAFRSPHHSISAISMCGGGSDIKPGEISLAHRGVLFLDELPEFSKSVIESLRQPIEDKIVQITRSTGSVVFPCNFLLIGAYNPCPCGYLLDDDRNCTCTAYEIQKYRAKLSGPILDRIDLQLVMKKVEYDKLRMKSDKEESSKSILERVKKAREIQKNRFSNDYHLNSDMNSDEIEKYCYLDEEEEAILKKAYESINLTARSLNSILKVSRTIADLDGSEYIKKTHLLEALQYRKIEMMNL